MGRKREVPWALEKVEKKLRDRTVRIAGRVISRNPSSTRQYFSLLCTWSYAWYLGLIYRQEQEAMQI